MTEAVLSVGYSPEEEWDLPLPSEPEAVAVPIEIVARQRQPRPPVAYLAGCTSCENLAGVSVLTGVARLADDTIEIAADRYTRTQALRLVALILDALNYDVPVESRPAGGPDHACR